MAWWEMRPRRERVWLALFGVALLLTCAWLFIAVPVSRDAARLERQIALQRVMLVEARREADEMAGLERQPDSASSRDPRTDIDASLVRLGLKDSATGIERVDGQRMRITFDAIAFDRLTVFIESMQRDAKLRVTELSTVGRVEPGQVSAELTLAP